MFDSKGYLDSVVKKWARDKAARTQVEDAVKALAGGNTEALYSVDLPVLFAVDKSSDLASHRKDLEKVFNGQRNNQFAQMCKRLMNQLDEQSLWGDASFWKNFGKRRAEASRRVLEEAADNVAHMTPLKAVVEEQFEQILTEALGSSPSDAERNILRTALSERGLSFVSMPVEGILKGHQGVVGSWRSAKNHAEFSSPVSIIQFHWGKAPDCIEFRPQLTSSLGRVSLADVTKSREMMSKRDSNALQDGLKFLGAVESTVASDSELSDVVYALCCQMAFDQMAGLPNRQLSVKDRLVKAGLSEHSAAAVTAVALSEVSAAGVGPRSSVDTVRNLISDGKLGKALTEFSALSPDSADEDEFKRLESQLDQLKAARDDARAKSAAALSERRFTDARVALAELVRMDSDDEDAQLKFDAVPPEPPLSVTAHETGRTVEITWQTHDSDGVLFTVVRSETKTPVSTSAGCIVASDVAKSVVDSNPPPGAVLHYSVFASRNGKSFSNPTSAVLDYFPGPTDVHVAVTPNSAVLSWSSASTVTASTVRVILVESGGASSEHTVPAHRNSVELTGLSAGSRYSAHLYTVYQLADGSRKSEPQTVHFVPRGQAEEPKFFTTSAKRDGINVRWEVPPEFDVEIWAFEGSVDLSAGRRITPDELLQLGGTRCSLRDVQQDGRQTTAVLPSFSGMRMLIPAVVDDTERLLGHAEFTGSVEPLSSVTAEVFDPDVRLTWIWPEGNVKIRISWTDGEGRARLRDVTKARYKADGGVVLRGPVERDVRVYVVGELSGNEVLSPSTDVDLPVVTRLPTVKVEQKITRKLFSGAALQLKAVTEEVGVEIPVMVIVSDSSFMPLNPSDGKKVNDIVFDFSQSRTFSTTVDLGKQPKGTWVRVFPLVPGAVNFIDPDTASMKG